MHEANEEYMKGFISNGAFKYVLSRHDNLSIILSEKIEEIMRERSISILELHVIASSITIDTRCILKQERKFHEWSNWLKFFQERGFVKLHPLFRNPIISD